MITWFAAVALAKKPGPPPDLYAVAATLREQALASLEPMTELTTMCDQIGHRLSGSPALEKAIVWTGEQMKADGLQVGTEPVTVTKWVRGEESATLHDPFPRDLSLLALGGSVGTPPGGITAEVVAVTELAEVAGLGERARGKIVLVDTPWTDYGRTVATRSGAAREAAKVGAVAALIRSVTPVSLDSPHTGMLRYEVDVPAIPAAALSTEDAALVHRLADQGPVRVTLNLAAATVGEAPSHNVWGQVRGRELPNEVVVLGCHLDSWDVGQGAQDDGAGCVMVMEAAALINSLPIKPRRTVRAVLFTNEENGLAGGKTYAKIHTSERTVAAIEADTGSGAPLGFRVQAGALAEPPPGTLTALAPLQRLLEPIGATELTPGGAGADVGPVLEAGGGLGLGLSQDMTGYWPIHHTEADTIDKVDPVLLARGTAAVVVAAWWLAEVGTLPPTTP